MVTTKGWQVHNCKKLMITGEDRLSWIQLGIGSSETSKLSFDLFHTTMTC